MLTQYKSHSLDRHISKTWRLSTLLGNYVAPVPAQQRLGPHWFARLGRRDPPEPATSSTTSCPTTSWCSAPTTSTGWTRSRWSTRTSRPARPSPSPASASRCRWPTSSASSRSADGSSRITAFREKPTDAAGLPDAPDQVFASMGNYVFTTEALVDAVRADAADESSSHDMGGNIIPMLVARGEAHVYDFRDNEVPGTTERSRGYWRDVGTLDSFYEAHMDLISRRPGVRPLQPAVADLHRPGGRGRRRARCTAPRAGSAWRSRACCRPARSSPARRSTAPSCRPACTCTRGRRSTPRCSCRACRSAGTPSCATRSSTRTSSCPDGARIGVDLDRDRELYTVSDDGVVVVGKGQTVVV